MKKPELLAPAGNMEKLKIAIHYGADAVYLGKKSFSLRAVKGGFIDDGEIVEAVSYAHTKGVKVYVTVNIFPHNRELSEIKRHLSFLNELMPDGIIVADPGIFLMAKELAPKIPLHVSTQANTTNIEAIRFWQRLGAKRINLARELSLEEIREISKNRPDVELELFVHGAVCISYSGRCYISSFLTGRSANLGECTNSCRWNYALMEETRRGEYFPVFEDERGSYLMNSRDLCLVEYLPELIEAGIDSFKIEGRMKGVNYVAGVVHTYRKALDAIFDGKTFEKERYLKELMAFSSRGYTTGMLLGRQTFQGYNYEGRQDLMTQDVVGIVREKRDGKALVELKRRLAKGMTIFFLSPSIEDKPFTVNNIWTDESENLPLSNAGTFVFIDAPEETRVLDIVRTSKIED
ncbi:MAG: U32 family peptidase [bacterium]